MPDLVLPAVYLLSYLPTPPIQCCLLFKSCLYIFENVIISCISFLFLSLHSLVYSIFFFIGLSWFFRSLISFVFSFVLSSLDQRAEIVQANLNWLNVCNFKCLPSQP